MTVDERLVMLQTLILWVLRHSRVVGDILKEVYKPGRKTDDSNISLAVHPWGMDREKNKYYLIEGKDDTYFRVYQEYISPGYRTARWISVAGSIDELRDLAERLGQEGSRNAKDLQGKILAAIPRFEEGEQKRKRREYRHARKAAFRNPGVSLYEGRTRGHKAKYTFESDESGGGYASGRATRSNRASGRETPVENYVTGSGRVTRRTHPFGFSSETNEAGGSGTPYAGSDSGGSARRSGRMSLKRDRYEYEGDDGTAPADYEDEEASDSAEEEAGDYEDDYKDEPVDEMDDDDLTDASDEDDKLAGKSLIHTFKFTTEAGKKGLAMLADGSYYTMDSDGEQEHVNGGVQKEDGAMDIDTAEHMHHRSAKPLSMPAQEQTHETMPVKVGEEMGATGTDHVVVNFLSGKGSNSSPASSISQ
ncbi:hypothetical protein ABW21_db0207037 [Orbilia brochopaga]|nr:hypothetical protein ABW21_db0207037 [Drechslerella brochopaga]